MSRPSPEALHTAFYDRVARTSTYVVIDVLADIEEAAHKIDAEHTRLQRGLSRQKQLIMIGRERVSGIYWREQHVLHRRYEKTPWWRPVRRRRAWDQYLSAAMRCVGYVE